MLMQTFLQMSLGYKPATVEWQRGGKNKRKIKCTEGRKKKKIISTSSAAFTHTRPIFTNKKICPKNSFPSCGAGERGRWFHVGSEFHDGSNFRGVLRPRRPVTRQKFYTKCMAESSGAVINMSESGTAAEGSALSSIWARH